MFLNSDRVYSGKIKEKDYVLPMGITILILTAMGIYISLRIFIPNDIATSAYGWSIIVNPVLIDTPIDFYIVNSLLNQPPGQLPFEGSMIGLGLLLTSVIFGFNMARSGPWVSGKNYTFFQFLQIWGKVDAKTINHTKVRSMMIVILVQSCDIITDLVFRLPASEGLTPTQRLSQFSMTFLAVLLGNVILSEILLLESLNLFWATLILLGKTVGDGLKRPLQKDKGYPTPPKAPTTSKKKPASNPPYAPTPSYQSQDTLNNARVATPRRSRQEDRNQ